MQCKLIIFTATGMDGSL